MCVYIHTARQIICFDRCCLSFNSLSNHQGSVRLVVLQCNDVHATLNHWLTNEDIWGVGNSCVGLSLLPLAPKHTSEPWTVAVLLVVAPVQQGFSELILCSGRGTAAWGLNCSFVLEMISLMCCPACVAVCKPNALSVCVLKNLSKSLSFFSHYKISNDF